MEEIIEAVVDGVTDVIDNIASEDRKVGCWIITLVVLFLVSVLFFTC